MIHALRKILGLLSPAERRRGVLVLILVIFMAILETLGIASIMPFLAVLGDPGVIERTPYLAALYARLGFSTVDEFLMVLALGAFGMVILAAIVRIGAQYAMNRYVHMRRHSISERLLETYLRQPYAFYLNRHSGDLAKSILSEVDTVIINVFLPLFDTIAYLCVAIMIAILLLLIDPVLAGAIALFLGGTYALIFTAVKGRLSRIGQERVHANRERFMAAGEAIGGIKDIKLLGREYAYLSRFRPFSMRFARHYATQATLAQVPKFLIEGVGVGGILALAVYLMSTGSGVGGALPVLGLYAFAGYRLLPAAQHIYAGITSLRFGIAAVEEVWADLLQRESLAEIRETAPDRLVPVNAISLRDVSFTYPGAGRPSLSDINLTIPVGASVGIVGGTGAGKTTLVDILLGLLAPSSGQLCIDDVPVSGKAVPAWQNALGYVPQQIFLADASIAENIALGINPEGIDLARVETCGREAQLHDFVVSELKDGYGTEIGERGVRLSGGQRQRIGIARALYRNPPVLVFDEATSALDSLTEQAVMDAVRNLSEKTTTIMIAHRLTTVKDCSHIVLLENGRISASGTFDELLAGNRSFRAMAAGSHGA